MNTAKHTPGPWIVNEEGRMVEAQLPNLRNEYEHICDLRGGIRGQINVANAHLIAAAPAMYEALRQSLVLVKLAALEEWGRAVRGEQQPPTTEARDREKFVKQALAQAEGK